MSASSFSALVVTAIKRRPRAVAHLAYDCDALRIERWGSLAHTTASQTCEERPRHSVIRACVGSGLGVKRLGTHNDPGRARWRSTGTKAELRQIISVLACEGFP